MATHGCIALRQCSATRWPFVKQWAVDQQSASRKWSMDDAFHEITHGRMEIPSLLMLRPKPAKPTHAVQPVRKSQPEQRAPKRPAPRPHKAEPARKKGKGKGKGKTWDNWAASRDGKPICRRFHDTRRTENPRFAHVCAIKGCQQAHGASQHPANRT